MGVAVVKSGDIKTMIDNYKNESESLALLLMQVNEGKIAIAAGVKNAPIKAGEWVKMVAKILDGNGGGRDDFATAGGKNVLMIEAAIKEAFEFAREKLLNA